VLTLHGPQRRQYFDAIADYDLVLTTYPLLTRDQDALLQHPYYFLILDEAQVIKNPNTRASRLVRQLEARYRLCLTGTPLENHLGELWSLFDFLLPGLLGDAKQFRRVLRNPIEKQGDEAASRRLAQRIRPFMLRRTKQEVVSELPPKTEMVRGVELEGAQRDLYESIRLAMHERVRRAVADQGLARSHIVVLDALLKLRQVCCDPRLVKLDSAGRVKHSAKLEMLMELLPEMIEEGRRVLLFSQFTGMLKLIEDTVRQAGVDFVKLTGRTRDRATPVERFQGGEAPLFLISLKAGGVGLNLTAADTVIHYDPWWNPAVERQATDRAHRIGQDNQVFVYKLITLGTVEEKIQAMQARKQALADSLFDRSGGMQASWTDADLDLLFEPLG
jgi:SNF2 family DNA or RNA helicase